MSNDVHPADKPITPERFNEASEGNHHGWLGFDVSHVAEGTITATLTVRPDHLNPGQGLHGGVAASFADSLCGYGVFTALPNDAEGFTTVELSANYLGKAADGDQLTGHAVLRRGGRQVQVWDVEITSEDRLVAIARLTQLIRYPKP